MKLTVDQIKQAIPAASTDNISKFIEGFNETFEMFDINTPKRVAMFLAQTAHESANFRAVVENLNYSANSLVRVWPSRYNASNAGAYARNPEKIANRSYADRMGNGSEASGDGWKYRGRGIIQLTGKSNYEKCGHDLDLNLVEFPDQAADDPVCVLSAGWFWTTRQLNKWADKGDVKTVTRKINGGYFGLDERTKHYNHAIEVLSDL